MEASAASSHTSQATQQSVNVALLAKSNEMHGKLASEAVESVTKPQKVDTSAAPGQQVRITA